LKAYDQAVTLNPFYAWAWNGRGLTLRELGQNEEAIVSYERAIQEDSHVIWYYINAIELLLDMDRKSEALTLADQATKVLPKHATAWSRQGQVLRRMEDYENALQSYARALEIDPQYAWGWNGNGLALAGLRRYDEAVAAYLQAVRYDDKDAWFWHNLGEAYFNLGRHQDAANAFERAITLDPKHETAREKLEDVRRRLLE
jgi:tetratricopeptide (TPR) repeat protein